jgi:hypothetical protein
MKFFGILPPSGQDDGNYNCNSRFPLGMTTRKARAKARTTAKARTRAKARTTATADSLGDDTQKAKGTAKARARTKADSQSLPIHQKLHQQREELF